MNNSMTRNLFVAMIFALFLTSAASAQTRNYGFGGSGWNENSSSGRYLGRYSSNRYDTNSIGNPYGAGSQYRSNGVNNPYSRYGSPYSSTSVANPYATNAPKLYDSQGNYRGRMSANRYDPDSISNPYGRFGSPYSSQSINNPYGPGSRYRTDSPKNPYGRGLYIVGQE